MGRIRRALSGRGRLITACLLALTFLGVLLSLHFHMAYKEVSGRNRSQLEMLARRADVRPEGFSFAVLGESRDSRRVFEGMLRNIAGDDSAFCVHLGDGVHSADITSYAYFLRQLELCGRKPLLMAAGPSELQGGGRRLFGEVFGDTYYSFEAGDCLFLVLDDRGGEGPDEEQLAWLRGELERGQERSCRLVFIHHPLFDPQGAEGGYALRDRESAERLLSLFQQEKVDMVFASHAPGFYQGEWGEVRYVVTGGAGREIEGRDERHRYYNYVRVSVGGSAVEVEAVQTPGPSSESWDRAAFLWSLHTYGFFAIWFWWDMALLAAGALLVFAVHDAFRRALARRRVAPEAGASGDVLQHDNGGLKDG